MIDFHSHSKFSFDSAAEPELNIKTAISIGLKALCFTDHMDYESNILGEDIEFAPEAYFEELLELREKYSRDLEILIGVEVGLQPHLSERIENLLNSHPFDYVIGSVHSVRYNDIYKDPLRHEISAEEMYDSYYKEMLEDVVKTKSFNTLGHIDYIDRLYKNTGLIPGFEVHKELIAEILKQLIERGRGIEVNTSGMRYGVGYYHPKIEVLKLYRDLGGELITLGSDSHKSEFIGENCFEAAELLKSLGYKYVFKYRNRTPHGLLI